MTLPLSRNTTYVQESQVKSFDLNNIQDWIVNHFANRRVPEELAVLAVGSAEPVPSLRTVGAALTPVIASGYNVRVTTGLTTQTSVRKSGGMFWVDTYGWTNTWAHYEENANGYLEFTCANPPGTGGQCRWDILQAKVTKSGDVTTLAVQLKAGTAAAMASAAVPTPDSGFVMIAAMCLVNGDATLLNVFDFRKPIGHSVYNVPMELANLAGSWTRDINGVVTAGAATRELRIPLKIPSTSFQDVMTLHRRINRVTVHGTITAGGSSLFRIIKKLRDGSPVVRIALSYPAGYHVPTMTWDNSVLAGAGGAIWMNGDHYPGASNASAGDAGEPYIQIVSNGAGDVIRSLTVECYGL